MNASNCLILSIEGNIGSGKSTVLQKLREAHPDWIFVDEPVNDWLALKNAKGESLLEVFYKDKQRWSYTFQNAAILYRFKRLQDALKSVGEGKRVIVMERCLETDRQIFSKMLAKDGFIDELEKKLYEDWFAHLIESCPSVDAYIYINTSAEKSFERLTKRARQGESIIPLSYLQELAEYHQDWLFRINNKPVLDFDNSQAEINISKVADFVANF